MGLDATAYSRLVLDASVREDEDDIYDTHVRVWDSSDFPGRTAPLAPGWYTYADAVHAYSGGYMGYGHWRDELAKLAGYPGVPHSQTALPYANGAWTASAGPFWELINFSDCEGVIGTDAAKKLAADFAEWDARARLVSVAQFYERYAGWRAAFDLAADGGMVDFH